MNRVVLCWGPPLLFCLLLLVSPFASGQKQWMSPSSAGVASERLERVCELRDRQVEQGQLGGVGTAVARAGRWVRLAAGMHVDMDQWPLLPKETSNQRIEGWGCEWTSAGLRKGEVCNACWK
ncbi:MAG: hypothetical protein P8N76_09790 [Pirellulaceae bacterium]|nr:hypothetical protein [Pirellulaceae bacterium]